MGKVKASIAERFFRKRFPGRISYLVIISLVSFFVLEALLSILAKCSFAHSGIQISWGECFRLLPKCCLELEAMPTTQQIEILFSIFRLFFFAALISLFYEVYKALIERNRIRYVENVIYNTFRWTDTKLIEQRLYYVPWYKTFAELKIKKGLAEEEIIRACTSSKRLRAANLASVRALEEFPHDKLVVECLAQNTRYGCRILRGSQTTIVVPSSTLGLWQFGFYLALFGDFNFIALNYDSEEFYDSYRMKHDKINSRVRRNIDEFEADVMNLKSCTAWFIILSSMSFRTGRTIRFLSHSMESKTSRDKKWRSVKDKDTYRNAFNKVSQRLEEKDMGAETKVNCCEDGDGHFLFKNSLINKLGCGKDCNGFDLRVSPAVNVWDPARIITIKRIAEGLRSALPTSSKDYVAPPLDRRCVGYQEFMTN